VKSRSPNKLLPFFAALMSGLQSPAVAKLLGCGELWMHLSRDFGVDRVAIAQIFGAAACILPRGYASLGAIEAEPHHRRMQLQAATLALELWQERGITGARLFAAVKDRSNSPACGWAGCTVPGHPQLRGYSLLSDILPHLEAALSNDTVVSPLVEQ
jgi:hypothetical protein